VKQGATVRWGGRYKVRRYVRTPGLCGGAQFFVHNNSGINGIRALVERVYLTPCEGGELRAPPACVAKPMDTLREFSLQLSASLGGARPMTRDQFLGFYTGRRRDVYARAAESLANQPLAAGERGVDGAFVKAEKINGTTKPDPASRCIQPRRPRFNVEVGVFLRHKEHDIYKAIADIYGGPTVMKGYNAQDVASNLWTMWNEFDHPVAIGLDASRFDQHVRPEMLQWEHSVYLSMYHGDDRRRLAWLLAGQIQNRCTMRLDDCFIKYNVLGSRMSGDMNTALGNCLIMCALVWRYAKERGVRVRLANNGDDCVLVCERRDLARITDGLVAWFTTYGFTMKAEAPVSTFEEIEFCQTHPVLAEDGWIMVRDPRICMSKDAVCTNPDYSHGAAARKWLYAVGDCGSQLASGIPILCEYYAAFKRVGLAGHVPVSVSETGMAMLARGLRREGVSVTDQTRVSFFKAFGILPSVQACLEADLRGRMIEIPSTPCIRHPPYAPGFIPI